MAAPTLQGSAATAAGATGSLTLTGAAAGDLLVLILAGSNPTGGGFTATRINDVTAGGTDAGFTYHGESAGSGTARSRIYSKVLTSADFTTGTLHTFGPDAWGGGTARIFLLAFRHARGWNANRVASYQHSEANVANSSTLITLADPSPDVPCAVVAAMGTPAAPTINWDGAGFGAVLLNGGGGFVDDKLYDQAGTPASITYNAGQNTTNHANQAVVFQVASPTFTTALETDTALPIKASKSRALGTALETDTAPPITQPGHGGGPITTALETDTARPLGRVKSRLLGIALETDTAQPIGVSKGHALGTALETDTAQPLVLWKTARFTVDLADPPLFPIASATAHVIARKDTPADAGDIRIILNQGSTPLGASAWTALGDTNGDVSVTVPTPGVGATLTATVEVRTQLTVNPLVDQVYVDLLGGLGTALETDTALPITPGRRRPLGIATEVDVAFPIPHTKRRDLGTAKETDEALPIRRVIRTPPKRAVARSGVSSATARE